MQAGWTGLHRLFSAALDRWGLIAAWYWAFTPTRQVSACHRCLPPGRADTEHVLSWPCSWPHSWSHNWPYGWAHRWPLSWPLYLAHNVAQHAHTDTRDSASRTCAHTHTHPAGHETRGRCTSKVSGLCRVLTHIRTRRHTHVDTQTHRHTQPKAVAARGLALLL